MSRLTALGSGLLLGAGLGIIIPEGVEATIEAGESEGASGHAHFPTTTTAISLLVGFMFMLVTEQLLPGAHSHPGQFVPGSGSLSPKTFTVEFDADVELGELEEDSARSPRSSTQRSASTSAQCPATPRSTTGGGFKIPVSGKGFTLTLGLVLHALSDGLALGSSITSGSGSQELSLVIFAALAIHKAPTALALTTSLLASGVNRPDCKMLLAIFSASTPTGAALAYLFLWFFQSADGDKNHWTGIAMLVSGGSFLYVATVLQPVSSNHTNRLPHEDDISAKTRLVFIIVGMFAPLLLSILVGHGHS
ncbi:hypothetical protein BDM02DRAFT_3118971 [Thelephora ganbajun]|uniref:Uncharacterized protein n=1 Tax=Thelephora ganbajun TaxID=370292 RepID=A0ACB6Z938_THEGA|nr:hypothetical protein BDM02DRAFT_3118971 [Thelephora ganbajun]